MFVKLVLAGKPRVVGLCVVDAESAFYRLVSSDSHNLAANYRHMHALCRTRRELNHCFGVSRHRRLLSSLSLASRDTPRQFSQTSVLYRF